MLIVNSLTTSYPSPSHHACVTHLEEFSSRHIPSYGRARMPAGRRRSQERVDRYGTWLAETNGERVLVCDGKVFDAAGIDAEDVGGGGKAGGKVGKIGGGDQGLGVLGKVVDEEGAAGLIQL